MKFGEGKSKIGFRNRIGRSGPAITTSALFLRFSFSLVIGIIARKIPEKVPRAILDDAAPGILTAEEAADLLHIAKTEDPEMLAYVCIGLFAGLRRSELCALEWPEIDLQARTIEVKGVKAKRASGAL
jgi:integrase